MVIPVDKLKEFVTKYYRFWLFKRVQNNKTKFYEKKQLTTLHHATWFHVIKHGLVAYHIYDVTYQAKRYVLHPTDSWESERCLFTRWNKRNQTILERYLYKWKTDLSSELICSILIFIGWKKAHARNGVKLLPAKPYTTFMVLFAKNWSF